MAAATGAGDAAAAGTAEEAPTPLSAGAPGAGVFAAATPKPVGIALGALVAVGGYEAPAAGFAAAVPNGSALGALVAVGGYEAPAAGFAAAVPNGSALGALAAVGGYAAEGFAALKGSAPAACDEAL